MFSILIHDEFNDSVPELWEEFETITDAVGYFNAMKNSHERKSGSDGIELVVDTEDNERVCLEYYQLQY
tara:strand:- start:729 stop:935 length:207 start_codon:yes stop_codon:yes gene_type:complete